MLSEESRTHSHEHHVSDDSKHIVAVVGFLPRKDVDSVLPVLEQLSQRQIRIVSVASDFGVGELVKGFCLIHKIPYLEITVKFVGHHTTEQMGEAYRSRFTAMIELATEFHVFTSVKKRNQETVEYLRSLLRERRKTFFVYGANNQVIESSEELVLP